MQRWAIVSMMMLGSCQSWQKKAFESKYAVNNCESPQYEDRRSGERVIEFGGTVGKDYKPRCMMVNPGQAVTFKGDFSAHPLLAGKAPSIENGWPGDKGLLPPSTSSGTTLTVSSSVPGFYGFYCGGCEASGMYGTILVVNPESAQK